MNIEILKKILKERKISYAELSGLSGISINTIKSVFCGKTKNPTIETVNAIKRALGLDTEDNDGFAQNYITQEENIRAQWKATDAELAQIPGFVTTLLA